MYKMNKNILHNGKSYAKDSAIDESDANFKVFHKDGHITIAEAKEVLPKSDAQPVEHEKPVGKPKK